MWLLVLVPQKQCPTVVLCKRFMREAESWTWNAGVILVKERGKEGKLGGRKHLILQGNPEKVQQGLEGYLSQITDLSQESGTFQA